MKATISRESSVSLRLLAQAWFSVTPYERLAILVVLSLFLLGLGARAWHLACERGDIRHAVPAARSADPSR